METPAMIGWTPPVRRHTPLPGEPGAAARWTPLRKAELLRRIRAGEVTLPEACFRWRLSREEIDGWLSRERRFGTRGLEVTKIREVRL